MDKNIIKQIIVRQQEFVKNVTLQERNETFEPNANYVLVGMRRAGKSYMLYQYIQSLLRDGRKIEEVLFVNFEDERISDIKKDELFMIYDSYKELYNYEPIIFLDEIQNVDGWEHYARRLADEKRRVFITGSNSHMLSREISSTLGGRYIQKEIYPFSFLEFLRFRNIELRPNWEYSSSKSDIVRIFSEYFYNGGLSEVFDIQDKQSWLQSLYHKILYSDIVVRKDVRNEHSLSLMIKKLADSVMQPMAVKRLQNILQGDGSKISRDTISNYLGYLQESYLMFGISNYSDSVAVRTTQQKHYFFDNGLLNLFIFQPETKLLENLVAITLYKRFGDNLFYYNRNVEVDFVVPKSQLLIQVSYDISDDLTREREFSALAKVSDYFNYSALYVITYNGENYNVNYHGKNISVIPVWKWLLV